MAQGTEYRVLMALAPRHGHMTGEVMSENLKDVLYQELSEKGQANGYAGLGANGFVPTAQLGSGAASAANYLRGDQSWAALDALSWYYFRHVGTTPFERWYVGAHIQALAMTTTAPAVNTMIAIPYPSQRGGTLDRIGFNVTTAGAAGSVARVGIYQATSVTNIYPDALIVDGGEQVTTSTGVKSTTINQVLAAGVLLWFVYLCGTAAPTIRGTSGGASANVGGIDSAFGTALGGSLSVAQAYGALPDPFTAGAAWAGGAGQPVPGVGVRYSA